MPLIHHQKIKKKNLKELQWRIEHLSNKIAAWEGKRKSKRKGDNAFCLGPRGYGLQGKKRKEKIMTMVFCFFGWREMKREREMEKERWYDDESRVWRWGWCYYFRCGIYGTIPSFCIHYYCHDAFRKESPPWPTLKMPPPPRPLPVLSSSIFHFSLTASIFPLGGLGPTSTCPILTWL